MSSHLKRQAELFGRLVMLADDLTGGCDAGVQFAQRGLSTKVHLGAPKIIGGDAGLTVLVTHSRRETPEQASSTVERACQWISSNGAILCFKKIDSTLQGNLGSELQTVLTNFEPRVALVAPAFPAMGRLLVNGMLQLNSNSKTESIHLPSLLQAQGVAAVAHIDQRLLRSGLRPVVEHIQKIQQEGTRALVVDASTDQDLAVIVSAAEQIFPFPLLVGSAGLATQLSILITQNPQALVESSVASDGPKVDQGYPELPVILFIGSTNPVTRRQLEQLAERREVCFIDLIGAPLDKAFESLDRGTHLVITIRWDLPETMNQLRRLIPLIQKHPIGGFIFSGGDTARLICETLRIQSIALERELLTGLPWGYLLGGTADGVPVCTKAGGFGPVDALVLSTDFLSRHRHDPAVSSISRVNR